MLKRLVQQVALIYLVCLSRTQSSEDGEAGEAGGACGLPGCGCEGPLLRCSGLNTTAQLRSVSAPRGMTRLEITASPALSCLNLAHFASLPGLQAITVRASGLEDGLCGEAGGRHQHQLRSLASLDLAHNSIQRLEPGLLPRHLAHLSLAHNQLRSLSFPHQLPRLSQLDLSHNQLEELDQLPAASQLRQLDLAHNPWPCLPSLAWLYTWTLALPLHVQESLSGSTCRIVNSPSRQHAPLLTVMQYYTLKVTPHCPAPCTCHFYHFAAGVNISPMATYTVIVNCTRANLTAFPSLPSQTTVLDLSYNQLSQDSYEVLDVVRQNYLEITSLSLAHNRIASIGTKLLRLKLHRSFSCDHNQLRDIPYDFSLLLQKYDHNNIRLGHNPWLCSCNAEITDTSLQEKIQDLGEVVCAEGSEPDSIVGRKLVEISSLVLCPRSQGAEQREVVLQVVCGVLTALILMTVTKLLYDYWNYRQRGKLPWIVYRMP